MGVFMFQNHFPVKGRTVLITGGSKGMGLEVGRQLAEKGANVVIVARDLSKLEEGIKYIQEGAVSPETQRFHHVGADLTAPEESVRVIFEVTEWNDGNAPDVVWCCAGSSHPTLFIDTPVSILKSSMDSNYFTSLYMAHAILKAWLRPEHKAQGQSLVSTRSPPPSRHLIFTASFLSFFTFAGYSSYSPTKAALRSLSDTLSQEMNMYATANPQAPSVRLHTIFPASIFTESYKAENRVKSDITKILEEGDEGQTTTVVAQKSIQGLESGQELVTTTTLTRLVMCSVLGGSLRGGFLKALMDCFVAGFMGIVMIFVRGDMDSKARKWGKQY
ncbi:hypothetical protein BJ878DRAFT_396856, partial [Calycina marina]